MNRFSQHPIHIESTSLGIWKRILNLAFGLVLVLVASLSSHGQTPESAYEMNLFQYEQFGNHPIEVAEYWNGIAVELLLELKQGDRVNMKDRGRIEEELRKVHGDWGNPDTVSAMILEKLKTSSLSGKEKRQHELDSLRKSKRTLEILGPELAWQLSLNKLQAWIRLNRNSSTRHVLRTHLAMDVFQNVLELTPAQLEQISKLTQAAEQEFKTVTKETVIKLKIESDETWGKILDRLNKKDKERVEELLGQPVQWYAEFEVPLGWSRIVRRRNFTRRSKRNVVYGSKVEAKVDEQGRWTDELEVEELAAKGIYKFDKFLFGFVSQKFVLNFLSLTPAQAEQWKAIEASLRQNAILVESVPSDRIRELELGENIYPKQILEWLTSDQLKILRWLEYQMRLSRKHRASIYELLSYVTGVQNSKKQHEFHFRELQLIKNLELDQNRRIALKGRPRRAERAGHKIYSEKSRIETELQNKIESVLTDQQRKKYKEFMTWTPLGSKN